MPYWAYLAQQVGNIYEFSKCSFWKWDTKNLSLQVESRGQDLYDLVGHNFCVFLHKKLLFSEKIGHLAMIFGINQPKIQLKFAQETSNPG